MRLPFTIFRAREIKQIGTGSPYPDCNILLRVRVLGSSRSLAVFSVPHCKRRSYEKQWAGHEHAHYRYVFG